MPFVPYTDEEIKTLKAKEGPRFVPYSDEELYNLKTEQSVKDWMDEADSFYRKTQNTYNGGQESSFQRLTRTSNIPINYLTMSANCFRDTRMSSSMQTGFQKKIGATNI